MEENTMKMNDRICDINFSEMTPEKKKCVVFGKYGNSIVKPYRNMYSLESLANNSKYKNIYIEVLQEGYNTNYKLYQEINGICVMIDWIQGYWTFSEMLERYDESEKLSKETFLNRLADAENNGSYINLLDIELCRVFNENALAEHYSEYRLATIKAREEKRQKERAEQEAREKAEEEHRKAEIEKNVQTAIQTLKDKKELENFSIEDTTIVLFLMKKFNIKVPLRTQGWISKALVGICWVGDRLAYRYYSSSKDSTVFGKYLNELIGII